MPVHAALTLDERDLAWTRDLRPETAAVWAATGGSALFSTLVYSAVWGVPIACGLVLGMWVHELGHRGVLRRLGLQSAPIVFVPFLGAVQRLRSRPVRALDAALIALAGPACGLLFATGCTIACAATGHSVLGFLGTAHAVLAVIDLLPIGPLDGKKVVAALSRGERIACTCAVAAIGLLFGSLLLPALGAVLLWSTGQPAPRHGQPWIAIAFVGLLGIAACLVHAAA